MKKIFCLKSLFSLLLLFVGMNVWGETATITFTAGTDTSTGTTLTKNGITLTATTFNSANYYQVYKSANLTVTSAVGDITKVEIYCTANGTAQYGPGCFSNATAGSYSCQENGNLGTWTNNEESVSYFSLTASSNQVRITKIVVTYNKCADALSLNLSTNETSVATTTKMSWENVVCSVVVTKGNAGTATNNTYPGNGKAYTTLYKNSILTFTPAAGITLGTIAIKVNTEAQANDFCNSVWSNANAIYSGTTVTITPQNGTYSVSATLGGTPNCTSINITYTGTPTSYTRSTSNGKFGTICLPYTFTATGAKIYTAALNANKNGVTLTEITGPTVAGTPYIYYATGDEGQTFNLSGEASSNPVSTSALTGIFIPKELTAGDYVMQTLDGIQAFYLVASGSEPRLSPYKAYILAANVPSNGDGKAINIDTEGETEGINALNALVNGEAKIYDLSGRQLKTLQKGINIVNGVKVIIK